MKSHNTKDWEENLVEHDGQWIKKDAQGNSEKFRMSDLKSLLKSETERVRGEEYGRGFKDGCLVMLESNKRQPSSKLTPPQDL